MGLSTSYLNWLHLLGLFTNVTKFLLLLFEVVLFVTSHTELVFNCDHMLTGSEIIFLSHRPKWLVDEKADFI